MEEAPVNLTLAVFVGLVAFVLFYLWRNAVALRDALNGKDGHRLMVIFARLFLVGAITSALSVVRWLSLVVAPDAEWLRQVIGFINAGLLISVDVWALLSVRAIIESGRMPRE